MQLFDIAALLLKWKNLVQQQRLAEIEIKEAVLQFGKSVRVGNVKATYVAKSLKSPQPTVVLELLEQ